MRFTVFGGRGFIGGNLARYLQQKGHEIYIPSRDVSELGGEDLGHVVYAIGLTGDFRTRLFDTVHAHVTVMADLLERCRFASWLYLSSTRVYSALGSDATANEDAHIPVVPAVDSVYDLSKLLGEALCLAQSRESVRVARLSNVYGVGQSQHTFLGAVLSEVRSGRSPVIRESPNSSKDYIGLPQVLPLLEAIALHGRHRLYNVASGACISHAEVAAKLAEVGARVSFLPGAHRRTFPRIDVTRIAGEFGAPRARLLDDLDELLRTA